MNTTMSERQADIVRLTKAAGAAAQQGRWDDVIQCYSERGILLTSTPFAILPTGELLKMDDELRERIHTVQAVLEVLLAKAQVTKGQMEGLRRRLGVLPSRPESVSIEA